MWLRGAEEDSLLADLVTIGGMIGLAGVDPNDLHQGARLVRRSLELRNDYLLVVDDIRDDTLTRYLPNGAGGVLLTTQLAASSAWESLQVPPFDPAEAHQLLSASTTLVRADNAVIDEIVDACSGLPLALAQVAAFSASTGIPARDHLALLEEQRAELLGRGVVALHPTLAASFELAYARLPNDGRTLLHALSSLGDAPVPTSIFAIAHPDLDSPFNSRLLLEDSVASLLALSLISRNESLLTVHSLIRELARAHDPARSDLDLATAALLVAQALPENVDLADAWPLMESLLPHLTELIARLGGGDWMLVGYAVFSNKVGTYLHSRGEMDSARHVMQTALARILHGLPVRGEAAGGAVAEADPRVRV